MAHDPRSSIQFSERDVDALVFIGEGYEVAQYQLHEAVFRGRSEVVVSRFVRRWAARGFLTTERWNNIGVNRLRITPACRDELVARGVAQEAQLFAPRKAVALKDVAHTLWINDVRVVLRASDANFDFVLPAWALQRRFSRAPRAIPDVLAIRTPHADDAGLLVAAEVDLGGERLNAIFLPKLVRLQELMRDWAGKAPARVLVLTRGAQRAAILERFAAGNLEIAIEVALLPNDNGREALQALRHLVLGSSSGVNSDCSVDLTPSPEQASNVQSLSGSDGTRLLEEESEDEAEGPVSGYTTTKFGFPTTGEEAEQRLGELAVEAREIRFRLLDDDTDKEFLWRRLRFIRDYVAEIERAVDEPGG
jgi:hypothetical protein